MAANPLPLLIYVALGVLFALWPIAVQWALRSESSLGRFIRTTADARQAGAVGPTTVARYCAVAVGLLLGSTLIWWRRYQDVSLFEIISYGATVVVLLGVLAYGSENGRRYAGQSRWAIGLAAALVCAVLSFSTGILSSEFAIDTTWHHWGAFIGPSELMISGARILYDIPAQYGFGPTAIIAAACRDNCWLGMHYVVGISIFAFSITIITLLTCLMFRSIWHYLIAILVIISVCFFWSAYPPLVTSPQIAPSVSGMRFLPGILMVAALMLASGPSIGPYWKTVGFLFYALGAFWSPEALFHVTYVWWPYFIWRTSSETSERLWPALARAVFQLLTVSVAILAAMLTVYRILYGSLPSLELYVAYLMYPPGAQPVDPWGPVWFTAAAMALGLSTLTQGLLEKRDKLSSNISLLVVLMGFAAISYCMGRGHSNNFLNILPFTALVLLVTFTTNTRVISRSVARGMLVSLLASLSLFGWGAWATNIKEGTIFDHDPRRVVSSFSYERPSSDKDFSDVRASISRVREKSSDPIEIIDDNYLPIVSTPTQAWSAIHGPANVFFLPREMRLKILRNTEKRLGRHGWVIIRRGILADWVEDYQSVYEVADDFEIGNYRALHLRPRRSSSRGTLH